jgi:hypothetical protein
MPNQYNFRKNIGGDQPPRFMASRIVSFPQEKILLEELPASFGFENNDNIEMHFYIQPTDDLFLSVVLGASDVELLKSHVVAYDDDTFKNYIRIEFTQLLEKKNLFLVPGEYRVVFNFFSDEIGSYNDKNMYIQEISNSRTEVQLAPYNYTDIKIRKKNQKKLTEFTPPSFAKPDALGATTKIFKSGLENDDPEVGLTYSNISDNLFIKETNQTFDNTIKNIRRLDASVEEVLVENLYKLLLSVHQILKNRIVIDGSPRIREEEFIQFIDDAIEEEFKNYDWSIDGRVIIN